MILGYLGYFTNYLAKENFKLMSIFYLTFKCGKIIIAQ